MDIHGLDLARCAAPTLDWMISLKMGWMRPGRKAPNRQIMILKEGDYADPPRHQGLGDTPSRVFKTLPEKLRPLNQVQPVLTGNLSYMINCEDYSGPLDREMTYLFTTYQFAMKKWRRCHKSNWVFDKEGTGHMWGLLAFACRETRVLSGKDLSYLLLSNPLVFEASKPLPSTNAHQALLNVIVTGTEEEAVQLAKNECLMEHWVILRNLVKGSCDKIILRLIDGLKNNDPMKTYFQMSLGQIPSAVAECGNINWGDWRPHLAMVLCNEDKFNLKKEIITKMAATLASARKMNSSYLCDLIKNLNCGIFFEKSASQHKKINQVFLRASRAALERDQIYKYVMALRPDQPFTSEIQQYRILCARMLLKEGYVKEALKFCCSVGQYLHQSEVAECSTLIDLKKLCSEFKDTKQFEKMGWYHRINAELFKRPKKYRISQLQIDPQVDSIMPSLETSVQRVMKSKTRNQPKTKRFLTPGPPKKKKSMGCFGWFRCFSCFCIRRKKKH